MSKHTPGPWFAIQCPTACNGKWRIDTTPTAPWSNFGEIAYANNAADARLIAAAPELLEALIKIRYGNYDNAHDTKAAAKIAADAIAKATN